MCGRGLRSERFGEMGVKKAMQEGARGRGRAAARGGDAAANVDAISPRDPNVPSGTIAVDADRRRI